MNDRPDQEFYQTGFMDLTAYRLEPAQFGTDWDNVVDNSNEGSIFCLSDYLQNIDCARPRIWYCLKGQETKAALVVIESDEDKNCIPLGYVVHHGIMFSPPPSDQSNAQTLAENFRITSFIVGELTGLYDEVFISTHPNFADIRPFLWHNYGNSGPMFDVDVRYTSIINLAGIDPIGPMDSNPVYRSSNKSRRQEIRYGIQKHVQTSSDFDVPTFLDLYRLTFERQNMAIDAEEMRLLEGLANGLQNGGKARMYISRTADGEAGSVAFFGLQSDRAYYLFGANDPRLRDQHTGTMVLWDAFMDLAGAGIKDVDLEGVNSPLRGHFKLSFGGTITPYYHLQLRSE